MPDSTPAGPKEAAAAAERIAEEEYFLLVSAFKIIKGDSESRARSIKEKIDADIAAVME